MTSSCRLPRSCPLLPVNPHRSRGHRLAAGSEPGRIPSLGGTTRSVAEHPQVTLKLQGLALIFGPTRSRVEPWVRTALSIFGARRCMFASHFPVDRLLWSWDEMLTVLEAVCDGLPEGDRYQFFSGCARREYHLLPDFPSPPAVRDLVGIRELTASPCCRRREFRQEISLSENKSGRKSSARP